jgi:hypothetical protein
MKRIMLCALLSVLSFTVNAFTIDKGTRFECSLLTPVEVDSNIACQVMGDVYSTIDKTLAIPAATRMVGKLVNGQLVWDSWGTPQGLLVTIPPGTFDTKLVRGNIVVTITALHDLKIEVGTSSTETIGTSKLDVNKYIACSSWGFSAVVLIQDAQQNKRSIEESVRDIYKGPQPYLTELANLGLAVSPDKKLKNAVEARRRAEFLSGVCYGAGDKSAQAK